ncbi:MAG: GNAT family N-acetyltransferase [Anaerolineales bacterium]|nr:GNAT family N-acetyltransferase [Anaerolineales bacterium]
MKTPLILSVDRIDRELLSRFFRQVYSPLKSEYLIQHGTWLCRSDANRYVIMVGEQIAGYCAVIPTKVCIADQVVPALWWVDIIIAPEFRGRGLQTRLDEHVRQRAAILLGFPNSVAAKIHEKHGWGVRNDMQVMLLPLWPVQVKQVRKAAGLQAMFLQFGARLLDPAAILWRKIISSSSSRVAWRLEHFDAELLSDIFKRTKTGKEVTTLRDCWHFNWRYIGAPESEQYSVYLAGDRHKPNLYLISRQVTREDGSRFTRILDIFGDFNDISNLRGIFLLVLQDAIKYGSGQVTMMTSQPILGLIARQFGFIFYSPVSFCWWSTVESFENTLAGRIHWVLGDSDNDEPY